MKNIYLAAALFASTFTLVGCGQKAEQPKVEQSQAPDPSVVYDGYKRDIEGLSQVGLRVTEGEYPITTLDSNEFNAAVSALEQRIKVDSTIQGTETSGQKAELLQALKEGAFKYSNTFRIEALNKQTGIKLKNTLLTSGKEALKENKVMQAMMALKGSKGYNELVGAHDNREFAQKVDQMFLQ